MNVLHTSAAALLVSPLSSHSSILNTMRNQQKSLLAWRYYCLLTMCLLIGEWCLRQNTGSVWVGVVDGSHSPLEWNSTHAVTRGVDGMLGVVRLGGFSLYTTPYYLCTFWVLTMLAALVSFSKVTQPSCPDRWSLSGYSILVLAHFPFAGDLQYRTQWPWVVFVALGVVLTLGWWRLVDNEWYMPRMVVEAVYSTLIVVPYTGWSGHEQLVFLLFYGLRVLFWHAVVFHHNAEGANKRDEGSKV
jgi:hypothetical protein